MGTGGGGELVGPPLCTSGYILDKELSRSSTRGRWRISPANKGTALFFCPFQLNPHRYTLGGGSVSAIRTRVRGAPFFGGQPEFSPNSIRNSSSRDPHINPRASLRISDPSLQRSVSGLTAARCEALACEKRSRCKSTDRFIASFEKTRNSESNTLAFDIERKHL